VDKCFWIKIKYSLYVGEATPKISPYFFGLCLVGFDFVFVFLSLFLSSQLLGFFHKTYEKQRAFLD